MKDIAVNCYYGYATLFSVSLSFKSAYLCVTLGKFSFNTFLSHWRTFEVSKKEYNPRTAFVFWIFNFNIGRPTDKHGFRIERDKEEE